MKREVWDKLSDIEKNKIIAEFLNWKSCYNARGIGLVGICPLDNMERNVPDFVNDLNAMHQAEFQLNPEEALDITYRENLVKAMQHREEDASCDRIIWFANADERALAFVWTMESR